MLVTPRRGGGFSGGARGQGGFSLIEVMIAVFVLGIGLLGFALMQTMNVRFTQSANFRTQATNLSYELLDQMRVNRVTSSDYLGSYSASSAECEPATGDFEADAYREVWECRLLKALGADATAEVEEVGTEVQISVAWGDQRWVEGADPQVFKVRTQL